MGVSIKDIAKIAGVSHTTVLKALHDKPKISKELKEKIIRIAKDNNYILNSNARNLALQTNDVIGVVVPDISIPLVARIVKMIESTCEKFSYKVVLFCSENEMNKEIAGIKELQKLRVAGILLEPTYKSNEILYHLRQTDIPFIVLGRFDEDDLDYITFDDCSATYKATEHLIKLGHQRIACIISGDSEINPYKSWLEGYESALRDYGIDLDSALLIPGNSEPESGYNAAREIYEMVDKPTALISFTDTNIVGILRGFKENNIKVPDDISLISLQDGSAFEYLSPSVTAISFPNSELGEISAQMLLNKISNGNTEFQKKVLPVELIIRESTDIKK